jgi:hypothetical protein
VLRAASALGFLLSSSADQQSDEPLGPFEPFLLEGSSLRDPVKLGIRAVIHGGVFEYQIEFDQTQYLTENLSEITPVDRLILFERRGEDVTGAWSSNERFELISGSFRPNALLLSLADRLAPKLAQGIAVGFRRLLGYYDTTWPMPSRYSARLAAHRACKDKTGFGRWMLGWIKDADLGVVGYDAQELPVPSEDVDKSSDQPPGARRPTEFELTFLHAGSRGPVQLPYSRESMGTHKLVALTPYIHDLVRGGQGRTYFIDEIGASLHPHLFEGLLRHFNCEIEPESVRGQLIFATHETAMLDTEAKNATLRRDQVYFTEKDVTGGSRLYSLAEFKERNNLNLRRRYLQGRYGALPSLGQFGD